MSKLNHKFNEVDSVTLGSGHSILLGHKPSKLPLVEVGKKLALEKQDTNSLGLFDSSSPNYTSYYPEVTAEDLNPKDDEFIYPVFRLLSETIVHKTFNPIDFSAKGVLKKSMQKLVGQSINIDHETAIGNAIGAVKEVAWGDSYTTENGLLVPAGINGTFKIDGKSNPRIARGILMDPPSIHSNSVTVRFKWEKSHDIEDREFMYKIGTYGEDGELIRRIVTDIVSYNETSLVAHGADPYAQIVDGDGKILNPEHANKVYSFSFGNDQPDRLFSQYSFIDYKDFDGLVNPPKIDSIENSIPDEPNNISNKQNNITMKQLIAQLAGLLVLAEGHELTEENLAEVVKSNIEDLKSKADLAKKQEDMVDKASFDQLKSEKEDAEAKLTSILSEKATEAIRVYGLAHGECPKSIEDVINNGSMETVEQFIADSNVILDEKSPLTCTKCGSEELSRRSSKEGNDDGDGDDGSNKTVILSNEEAMAKLLLKKKNNSFFGKFDEEKK